MLIPLAVADGLAFPASSVQVPDADCPAPSLLSTTASEQKSIPASASLPRKETVTSLLFQPFAFGPGGALAATVGAVLSMLMPACASPAVFPARSSPVPTAD